MDGKVSSIERSGCDVNGLKLSNDIFGHKKGDEFLVKIAKIIRDNTREDGILFRVGGDEFYIFMKNTSEETSRTIMAGVSSSIYEEDFHGVRGGNSLGLSVVKSSEVSLDRVMSDAEQEMYRVKIMTKSNDNTRQLRALVDIIMGSKEERVHAENTVKTVEEIGRALSLSKEEIIKLKDEDTYFVMKKDSGTILDASLVDLLIEIKKKKALGA